MVKVKYKVDSFRGDLALERGLNEIAKQGYDAKWVFADNGKYVVVYRILSFEEENSDTVENTEEE